MSVVINIMSKNPDFCECKTRLKSLLSREERIYITKHMLDITCSVVSKFDTTNILHLFPNKEGKFIKNLSNKYNIIVTKPSFQPNMTPIDNTTKVCIVIGTG